MVAQIAAWIATIGFAAMVCFQLLLALGLPLGRAAWRGKYTRLPTRLRIASLLSIGVYVYASICVLEKGGVASILESPQVVTYSVWVFVAYLGLNTAGNLASKSRLERRIMTPASLVLGLMCLTVAIAS